MAEKILARSAGLDCISAGEVVSAAVDCAMLDDALGPHLVDEGLRQLGNQVWDPEKTVLILDHYVPSGTVAQANIAANARKWAAAHHITHIFDGCGPCHQILAENGFDLPGTVQVGVDSHTVTAGAFGCFGTGIGSTEMAAVLATGRIWLRVPGTVRIHWEGKLPPYVAAKDMFLRTIRDLGHDGASYMAVEYTGETISGLCMDERMCLSNMSVEAGAKAGLIACDRITEDYLKWHAPERTYVPLYTDDDAEFAAEYTYNADMLVPQVAIPHSVEQVIDLCDADPVPVHCVYIGSCCGGRLHDLETAARLLKGHRAASGCRLLVCPASRATWLEAEKKGVLGILADAGAVILAPTCGACVGYHSGLLADGENCVSTTNRNFRGRMGSPLSNVYLTSAFSAAACAITGRLTDPARIPG